MGNNILVEQKPSGLIDLISFDYSNRCSETPVKSEQLKLYHLLKVFQLIQIWKVEASMNSNENLKIVSISAQDLDSEGIILLI